MDDCGRQGHEPGRAADVRIDWQTERQADSFILMQMIVDTYAETQTKTDVHG